MNSQYFPPPDLPPLGGGGERLRAVYFGQEGQTVTGKSMDWLEDMQTNLWTFPCGIKRDGGMDDVGFKWTSKFGSVIAGGKLGIKYLFDT